MGVDIPRCATKIDKQNAKTDKALTLVFNRLSKDLKISAHAVITNEGVLTQNIGTANSFGEYIKTAGFRGIYVPTLTPQQIEQNEAFKTYKNKLADESAVILP
mgnify:CR=1 FL=1